MKSEMFGNRYTIFPDGEITSLHCYTCNEAEEIGYHPSLDLLIQRAAVHEMTNHA